MSEPPAIHEPRPARDRRWWAAPVAVTAAIGAVVAIAVLAARSGGVDDEHSVPRTGVPAEWIDLSITVMTIVGVLLAIAVVIAHLRKRGGGHSGRELVNQRFLSGAVALLVVLFLVGQFVDPAEQTPPEELEAPPSEVAGPDQTDTGTESPSGWPVVVALLLGAVAVGAVPLAGYLAGRRRRDAAPDQGLDEVGDRRDRLIGLLDAAIDDLRVHPDPREAVIAAWARLEDAFELTGLERRRSDTPLRYLERALRTVDASAPSVAALTSSFEEAMFSDHPIGRPAQLGAVDALVAVRDDLRLLASSSAITQQGATGR